MPALSTSELAGDDPTPLADALVDWARASLPPAPVGPFATSWAARVCREFAPVGLADGAWLRGSVLANRVETPLGMLALRQLMLRFGDPSSREAYSLRYASLLRSLGTPPESITRWDFPDSLPCADLSFEHALLGLGLGFFASSLGPEIVGFNLWMASLGPCPLLDHLLPSLRSRGACLRYFDLPDRSELGPLARRAIAALEADLDASSPSGSSPEARLTLRRRVARGFFAAHRSYLRWHLAMLGRNVPFSPETSSSRASSARLASPPSTTATSDSPSSTSRPSSFKDATGTSASSTASPPLPLVTPGSPDISRFLTHTLSIDGPMFDSFTAPEKLDLAEWIASLPSDRRAPVTTTPRAEPLPLAGFYAPPHDLDSLRAFSFARYGQLSNNDLYFSFANSDLHPTAALFARAFVEDVLGKLALVFDSDPRLDSKSAPPYSERVVAQLVAQQHDKNVRSRTAPGPVRGGC